MISILPIKTFRYIAVVLSCIAAFSSGNGANVSEGHLLRDGDRIVFAGDSITGQGGNNGAGFVHLIEGAMRQARPGNTMQFSALGGSGQPVHGWIDVEQRSREKEFELDVKGVGVKATLDQGAEVLVIMLGMNDVIAPYVTGEAKAIDAWGERYRRLIQSMRERLKPRVMALGQITMSTEEPLSPKNRVVDALNEKVAALAREENCLLLPTHETMQAFLEKGRRYRSDFHVLHDQVHPTAAGHIAIAEAMLHGLGENLAEETLIKNQEANIWKGAQGELPALAWRIEPLDESLNGKEFRLRYWWTGASGQETPRVSVTVPAGWEVHPSAVKTAEGEFILKGTPDRRENKFLIEGKAGEIVRSVTATLPAPWLIGTGLTNNAAWSGNEYDPTKGELAEDAPISRGDVSGSTIMWRRYFPTVNCFGGADPENIDFWASSFGKNFEVGYGARWIQSDRERPVTLLLSSKVFAGKQGLKVWLNGAQVYAGTITMEPGKKTSIPAQLRQGINSLVLKSNHQTWLWEVAIGINGGENDSLADLRYSVQPPAKIP